MPDAPVSLKLLPMSPNVCYLSLRSIHALSVYRTQGLSHMGTFPHERRPRRLGTLRAAMQGEGKLSLLRSQLVSLRAISWSSTVFGCLG
jgi:hypothetical protein